MLDEFQFLFSIYRTLSSFIVLISVIIGVYLWVKGILPVLLRLGVGLTRTHITIFAKGDNLRSLRKLLQGTNLFRENNISEVANKGDIDSAKRSSLILLFWHDWSDDIDDVLALIDDEKVLIVYAPTELGYVPRERMEELNKKRYVAITNYRGRLLSDIIVSMITRSYKK